MLKGLSKAFFLVAALFFIQQALAAKPTQEVLVFCTGVSEMANAIMTARQNDASMAKLMKAKSGDEGVNDLSSTMIEDAFSTSSFSTAEFKNKAISEFENKWFAACIKAKNK